MVIRGILNSKVRNGCSIVLGCSIVFRYSNYNRIISELSLFSGTNCISDWIYDKVKVVHTLNVIYAPRSDGHALAKICPCSLHDLHDFEWSKLFKSEPLLRTPQSITNPSLVEAESRRPPDWSPWVSAQILDSYRSVVQILSAWRMSFL